MTFAKKWNLLWERNDADYSTGISTNYWEDNNNCLGGILEQWKAHLFLLDRFMFPGVFVYFSLSSLACLATSRLTANPNTRLPVTLALIRSAEGLMTPSFATKIPLALQRFIGVVVSRKTVIKWVICMIFLSKTMGFMFLQIKWKPCNIGHLWFWLQWNFNHQATKIKIPPTRPARIHNVPMWLRAIMGKSVSGTSIIYHHHSSFPWHSI